LEQTEPMFIKKSDSLPFKLQELSRIERPTQIVDTPANPVTEIATQRDEPQISPSKLITPPKDQSILENKESNQLPSSK